MIIEVGQTQIEINNYPIPESKVLELSAPVMELFAFEFKTPTAIKQIKYMIDEIVTNYIRNSREDKLNELLK
jgi:hypothetical protein